MAEKVTMWKAKNGKFFETHSGAEQEERAEEIKHALYSLPDEATNWSFDALSRELAEQGYRITNINPASA